MCGLIHRSTFLLDIFHTRARSLCNTCKVLCESLEFYSKLLFHLQALDPQQEAKEELKNMKKQHALLTRILQQQEQLRALKGRQAALLALQHKTEQAIAVMDDSGKSHFFLLNNINK